MSTESDLKNMLITATKANNALVRELKAQTKAMNALAVGLQALALAIAQAVDDEGAHDQSGAQEGAGLPLQYMDGSKVGG